MPLEMQIIRASEFIRLGAEGQFDLEASKKVLAELAGACRKRGIDQAMLDLRALHPGPTPVFTPSDLATLINTFREIGFTHQQRLAILYSADPHHRARMFAFLGTLRGWQVRAFGTFEEAVLWLSGTGKPEAETESQPEEHQVPLKIRGRGDGGSKAKTKIRPKK